MSKGKYIDKQIKDQILSRIKNDGIPATQAAKEHGIKVSTVYGWLSKRTDGDPSILEVSRLKRQNEELLRMIGKLTVDIEQSKKRAL